MENMFQQQTANNSWMGELPAARMAFKYHAIAYLLMSVFFWLGWFSYGSSTDLNNWLPWPLYPMLFGAVALFLHFLAAFVLPGKTNTVNTSQKLN